MEEEANELLKYIQKLDEDQKQNNKLISTFKDCVVDLNSSNSRADALIKLYNTFIEVDKNVLIKLNTFLPPNSKYIKKEDGSIELSQQLKQYQLKQLQDENSTTYDIFLKALHKLAEPEKSQKFKDLISKFVNNKPEQRLEVLQFLVEACLLLFQYPELLAGLIGFLNTGWQQYAQKNLGVVSIKDFAVYYGVIQQDRLQQLEQQNNQQQDSQLQKELFGKIIEIITNKQLTKDQKYKRDEIISNIQESTQQMQKICNKLLQQMNRPQQNQQVERQPRQQQNQRQVAQIQNPLQQVLDCQINMTFDQMADIQNKFYKDALNSDKFLLDLKVPVSAKMVDRLSDLSVDQEYLFQQVVQIYQGKTVVNQLMQLIAIDDLQKQLGSDLLPLTFDDCIQADRALRFKKKCQVIDKLAINVPQQEKQQLYNHIYNELVKNTYSQVFENETYIPENLVDSITFFNTNSSIQFQPKIGNSSEAQYTYVPINSQPLKYKTKTEEKPGFDVLSQCQVEEQFQRINNMTLQEQHKYYKKQIKLKDIPQTQESYKGFNELRNKLSITHQLINYRVISAFQQGHDNTSCKGLNPYQLSDLTQQDILKTLEEVDDPNMLEEYLHRYDVFMTNLQQIEIQMETLSHHEETGLKRPNLPQCCYQLLQTIVGEQYLQLFYQEPIIVSKYIRKIVTQLLNNLIAYRSNVFSPVYETKLKLLYFKNHDWTQQTWQENDKKLLSIKSLQIELQQHKKVVGTLQKSLVLEQLQPNKTLKNNTFKKYSLPWDNEFVDNSLLTYEDIIDAIQNAKAAGCKVLIHASNQTTQDDQILEQFDRNREIINKESANYIQYCKQFKSKNQQGNKHFCSDIHHIIIKFVDLDQYILQQLKKQVVDTQYDQEQQEQLFDLIIRLIQKQSSLIDSKLYQFIRLLLIIIERLVQLKEQVNNKPIQMENYLQEQTSQQINSSLILKPRTTYLQHLQSQQLYSGFQQLYLHKEQKLTPCDNNFDLLLQILTSNRKTMQLDIYALFGLDCYKALTMSQILQRLKTLFKELFLSYQEYNAIINKRYDQISKKFDSITFSAYLVDLQTTKGVILLLDINDQFTLDNNLEENLKMFLNLAGTDLMVMERVNNTICWSVLDL